MGRQELNELRIEPSTDGAGEELVLGIVFSRSFHAAHRASRLGRQELNELRIEPSTDGAGEELVLGIVF